ncbi:MAG: SH3 domain-containing protein [Nocardioidaceae bacterium]
MIPALAALAVTGTVAGVNLAASGAGETPTADSRPRVARTTVAPPPASREQSLSRSAPRVTLDPKPPKPTGRKYLTAPLKVWTDASEGSRLLDVLPAGTRVGVTGVVRNGFAEVVRDGQARWVNAAYLSDRKPAPAPTPTPSPSASPSAPPTPTTGSILSSAPCATGSGMESRLVPDAIALHRAVCAHFPQVKVYFGYRPDGEHADGHAVDIMVYNDSTTGQEIADWVKANAGTLKVSDIIWSQHIWTPVRASEGWRLMPDRGSRTANHYDHVHVRVN